LSTNSGLVTTALAWRDHRARPPQRLVQDADVGAVGHRHDDALARCDAQPGEAGGNPPGAVEQFAGAVPAILEQQRLIVAAPFE
jgi:hypothetical protein